MVAISPRRLLQCTPEIAQYAETKTTDTIHTWRWTLNRQSHDVLAIASCHYMIQALRDTHTRTHTQTLTHTHKPTHTDTHTQTLTPARHTHTHTHTNTHTHTQHVCENTHIVFVL